MTGDITGQWAVYATDQIDTTWSDTLSLTITVTLEIAEELGVPSAFALHPAYPNPFNPVAIIQYDLPHDSDVILVVYDIIGREVVRLVDGMMAAGYQWAVWNGKTANGRELPSGIYIARLVAPEYSNFIKMVLLK